MIKNGWLICLQIHAPIVSLVLENCFPENALHRTSNSGNLVIVICDIKHRLNMMLRGRRGRKDGEERQRRKGQRREERGERREKGIRKERREG